MAAAESDRTTVAPAPGRRWRWPLDIHLAVLFGGLIGLIALLIGAYVVWQSEKILLDVTHDFFHRIELETGAAIERLFGENAILIDTLAAEDETRLRAPDAQTEAIERLRAALVSVPSASAIYVGYDDGAFVLLRRLTSDAARRNLDAPAGAAFAYERIEPGAGGHNAARFVFFGPDAAPLASRDVANFGYDPRARDWYRAAAASDGLIETDPYLFFASHEPGITLARKVKGGHAVAGVDLSLADLSRSLAAGRITPATEIALVDSAGRIVGSSEIRSAAPRAADANQLGTLAEAKNSPLAALGTDFRSVGAGVPRMVEAGDRRWEAVVEPIARRGGSPFYLLIATPYDEIVADARRLVGGMGAMAGVVALLGVALVIVVAQRISRPLRAVTREAVAIRSFRLEETPAIRSVVAEADLLGVAVHDAKATIGRFVRIGHALAAEHDLAALLERILQETVDILGAEGGVIYLSRDQGATFRAEALRWGEHGAAPDKAKLPPLLADGAGLKPGVRNVLAHKEISVLSVREVSPRLAAIVTGDPEIAPSTDTTLVCIPLRSRRDALIGVMVLAHAALSQGATPPAIDLARAVSGNAAITIETMLLLRAQRELLDALIKLVARAIDTKSPYTSRHCQAIPVLTRMLAEAACDATDGPYKDFDLGPEEWEALDIASWLHDCGKLTTKEYVLDKATKLETVYDRIHEIRMRFEVMKRDARLHYWQARAEGGDRAALEAELARELAALDEDFAFVAACNRGGESMTAAALERLKRIGARRWTRTLDDRLGVSSEEAGRKPKGAAALPVEELLLADKPEHLVAYAHGQTAAELERGFKMRPPEHRLNLGELYNLSITRGTLTEEERYEINRHISLTILMLESLPLPPHLRNVPELAGGHHEKMDGTGYPFGLTRDEMSPVARMMAIADVFEALTSSDRPYKKAKPLSEAIRIMGFMKRDRHLDPDLLDLFLRTGVWKRYAERFLDPGQIDEPDVAAVLKTVPAGN
ncbi:MAG TPA: HD domain-containing phosphohydrolase [Alphaproteobacteria bacterium]|nr:HD domain-containing phosphohydrolase [Alphaproteobacteria bacterium]